jgi:hypothetical protein
VFIIGGLAEGSSPESSGAKVVALCDSHHDWFLDHSSTPFLTLVVCKMHFVSTFCAQPRLDLDLLAKAWVKNTPVFPTFVVCIIRVRER